jgi:hypothetical protein
MRVRVPGDLLWRPLRQNLPTAMPAFRAKIDDPVRGLDDVQIVLDDNHCIAVLAQPMQYAEQQFDIVEVQAGGGLVEDVERVASVPLGELSREFDALCLATRQRRRLLSQLDIGQANVHQGFKLARNRGYRLEQVERIFHCHIKHLMDGVTFVSDIQRLAVVAFALTDIAGNVDVGQEVHFDLYQAIPLAGFTATAFHVEAEATCAVAAGARFRNLGEQLAQWCEQAGVGRWI